MQTRNSHQVCGTGLAHERFHLGTERGALPHAQPQHNGLPGVRGQRRAEGGEIAGAQVTTQIDRRSMDETPANGTMLGQGIALSIEAAFVKLSVYWPNFQRHLPALSGTARLRQILPVQVDPRRGVEPPAVQLLDNAPVHGHIVGGDDLYYRPLGRPRQRFCRPESLLRCQQSPGEKEQPQR